jgi:pyroglutamyl-peptidase
MKALVTGFEPFDGDALNPSAEILKRLSASMGPMTIETALLPTAFGRGVQALDAAVDLVRPDIVLSIGLSARRSRLSLERVAVNVMDSAAPDNDGARPQDRPVVADGPAGYFATLPLKPALAGLLRAGLPAEISNTAGTYVCNAVFYALMHRAAAPGAAVRAGFLHVPMLPQQAAIRDGASMALEHMIQGVQIILAITADRHAASCDRQGLEESS